MKGQGKLNKYIICHSALIHVLKLSNLVHACKNYISSKLACFLRHSIKAECLYVYLLPINTVPLQSTQDMNQQLVDWCLTALSAQTRYIVPQKYEIYYAGPGNKTSSQLNNSITKKIVNTLWPGLCGDDPFTTIRLLHRSLSSQSLGKY